MRCSEKQTNKVKYDCHTAREETEVSGEAVQLDHNSQPSELFAVRLAVDQDPMQLKKFSKSAFLTALIPASHKSFGRGLRNPQLGQRGMWTKSCSIFACNQSI